MTSDVGMPSTHKVYIQMSNWYHTDAHDDEILWQPFPHGQKHISVFKSSPPEQNVRLLADNIFRCIFVNENCSILIEISLKYVSKGPIDNNPALV